VVRQRVTGFLTSPVVPLLMSLAMLASPSAGPGLVLAGYQVANGFSTLVGGAVGSNWVLAVAVSGACCVVFGLFFWLVIPEPRQSQPQRIRDVLPMLKNSYRLFFRATFAAPSISLQMLVGFLMGSGSAVFTLAAEWLAFEKGEDPNMSNLYLGSISTAFTVPGFVGSALSAKYFYERYGFSEFHTAAIQQSIVSLFWFIMLLIPYDSNKFLFFAVASIGGVQMGTVAIPGLVRLLRIVPPEVHGSVMAATSGCVTLSSAFFAKLASTEITNLGSSGDPYSFSHVFTVAGAITTLVILVMLVQEHVYKRDAETLAPLFAEFADLSAHSSAESKDLKSAGNDQSYGTA